MPRRQNWIRFVKDEIIKPAFVPGNDKPTGIAVSDKVYFLIETLHAYDEAVEAIDMKIVECGTVVKKVPCELFVMLDDTDVSYEDAYPTLNI